MNINNPTYMPQAVSEQIPEISRRCTILSVAFDSRRALPIPDFSNKPETNLVADNHSERMPF